MEESFESGLLEYPHYTRPAMAELAAAWAHVTAEAGAYQGAGEPAAAQASGLTNVCVPLRFDACVMEGCAAFDTQGKVAGLHFLLNTDGHGTTSAGGEQPYLSSAPDIAVHRLWVRRSRSHVKCAVISGMLWKTVPCADAVMQ